MPFGELGTPQYGKLIRNKSTSTGVTGTASGFTREGAPADRSTPRGTPNPNAPYGSVGGGSWGGGKANALQPTPQAAPYDPAASASAAAAAGAAARDAAGMGSMPAPPTAGTESGPGILEDWFNQRAKGIDSAYEYATNRGMQKLGTASAARGGFNSGAARQQESDFMANMGAQRMGQLDSLAAGASGEHQGRLNSMFGQGLGLAGGQSGINSSYDLAAGKAMSDALSALLGFTTNKAGVDSKSNQQGLGNILGLLGLF